MEIKSLFNIIMKRFWIIIALPLVIIALVGYVNFYVFVPIYQAHTTLLITGLSSEIGTEAAPMSFEDIIAGQTLVYEYSEIIKSRRVTSAVLEDLKLGDLEEDELKQMIEISSLNDTRIIAISVVNEDPSLAVRIADSVAKVFSSEITKLYRIENINVIDMAKQPEDPIAPTKKKNILIAFMATLIFAVSLAFLIEYLDNTIKTAEDVEKHLSLTVIGTIPVHTLK